MGFQLFCLIIAERSPLAPRGTAIIRERGVLVRELEKTFRAR
jgi:hypothetical protein